MTRSCAVCGVEYEASRSTSRYCSSSCRGVASKRRAAGVSEAFTVSGVTLPARPGRIRADLAEHLEQRGAEGHPLASALLALADRVDAGNDPLSGLAVALRQLEQTLATITGNVDRGPDAVDCIRLRHVVGRIDPEKGARLREILDGDMIDRVRNYSRATWQNVRPAPVVEVEELADDE